MYAQAALVPCGLSEDDPSTPGDDTRMCQFCDFFQLIDNVKNFVLVDVVTPLGVLFIVIGGVMMLFGGQWPAQYARGKGIVQNTVIGVFLIFSTWMITNTIIQLVAGDSNISQSWYQLSCRESALVVGSPGPTPSPGVSSTPGRTPAPTGPVTGGQTLTCDVTGLKKGNDRSCITNNNGRNIATCANCTKVLYAEGTSGDKYHYANKNLADFLNNKLSPALKAAGISAPYYGQDGMCPRFRHASCAHFDGHAMDIKGAGSRERTEKICQILNSLGVQPVPGLSASSRNVYIVESNNPRDTNPNSACPRTCGGRAGACGGGLHIQM